MKTLLVLLVLSMGFFAAVVFARVDYRAQQKVTLLLAYLGDTRAQSNVGNMYYFGQHTYIDFPKAIEWYTKAAEQGNNDAIMHLVNIYTDGSGVPKNAGEVFRWTKIGAEKGLGWAENYLGTLYLNGTGTEQNYAEAMTWYKRAALKNAAPAKNNIGYMYYHGLGVPVDKAEAFKWFKEEADNGYTMAQMRVAAAYEQGEGVEQNYDEAIKWYKVASENSGFDAYGRLIDIYTSGNFGAPNNDEALLWATKAVDLKIPNGLSMLSYVAYKYATATPPNETKAFEILSVTANAGDKDGQLYMGDMYFFGKAVKPNWLEAARWYKKSADQGNQDAKINRLEKSQAICANKKNPDGSIFYDLPACFIAQALNDPAALFAVGEAYELGLADIESDPEEAVSWFQKSAQLGYLPAQQRLAYMHASGEKINKDPVAAYAWYSLIGARKDITEKQRANAEQGRVFAWGQLQPEQLEEARAKKKEFSQKPVVAP